MICRPASSSPAQQLALSDFENRFQTRFQAFEDRPAAAFGHPEPARADRPGNLATRRGQIAILPAAMSGRPLLDAQGALQQLA